MGWPYTCWDGVRGLRLTAPNYGGEGKTPAIGNYAAPMAAVYQPRRAGLLDIAFYNGKCLLKQYRNGAFAALHGAAAEGSASGQAGYNVVFVPFKNNKAWLSKCLQIALPDPPLRTRTPSGQSIVQSV